MISVCIPAYEMNGEGEIFLRKCLGSVKNQTYTDYEIIVADNSNSFEELCKEYGAKWFYNPAKGMAQNTNFAMKRATGELIKILYQDDVLASRSVLEDINNAFTDGVMWLATGCISENGTHFPYFTQDIYLGNNKIGSPSVITVRNKDLIFFDENMTWVLDCDYYKRMYDLYGEPEYLYKVSTRLGLGKHQTTNVLSEAFKIQETNYMKQKYE